VLPDPGFLQSLRTLTRNYGTLLIFDEVMSGFRIALGGVQEALQITPDLTALGKIIGGGLPVGAFGGRAEIMDCLAPLGPVYQAGTLSGNPLALAAGMEAITLLHEAPPYARLEATTRALAQVMSKAFSDKGIAVQIPQAGSMLSVFFAEKPVRSFTDVMNSGSNWFRQLFHACLGRGLFLPPSAYEAWFVSTAHDEAILARSSEILVDAIQSL
jgi:glutamate-1-semialdehyde 2,1-aminomutase